MNVSNNAFESYTLNRSLVAPSSLLRDHRVYTMDRLHPMSLNTAYATKQAKNKNPLSKQAWKNKIWRRKTTECEFYQFEIRDALAYFDDYVYKSRLQKPDASQGHGVAMSIIIFVPPRDLRTNDGTKFRKFDSSNCIKLIEDAVFEHLGFDDSYSLDPVAFKRESWDEHWHITIVLSPTSIHSDLNHGNLRINLASMYDSPTRQASQLIV